MHDDSVQIALQKFELNSKSENMIYDVVFYQPRSGGDWSGDTVYFLGCTVSDACMQ